MIKKKAVTAKKKLSKVFSLAMAAALMASSLAGFKGEANSIASSVDVANYSAEYEAGLISNGWTITSSEKSDASSPVWIANSDGLSNNAKTRTGVTTLYNHGNFGNMDVELNLKFGANMESDGSLNIYAKKVDDKNYYAARMTRNGGGKYNGAIVKSVNGTETTLASTSSPISISSGDFGTFKFSVNDGSLELNYKKDTESSYTTYVSAFDSTFTSGGYGISLAHKTNTRITKLGIGDFNSNVPDPVDPVDPTDPVDPVDPIDPVDPTDPVDPVDPVDPEDPIPVPEPSGSVEITSYGPWFESAYVEWKAISGYSYNVYYKLASASSYTKVDDELVRGGRVDVLGLKGNTNYQIKVAPVANGVEALDVASVVSVKTDKYDRSGFAFSDESPYGNTTGGYNLDGTVPSDAIVLYVTNETKDTITADIQTSTSGTMQTGVGIAGILKLREKKADSRPMIIRFIGEVHPPSGVDSNYLLNVKKTTNTTVEGVGNDAFIYGWGFNIRECSNVEVRNLAFYMFPDDSVSIQTKNRNIWVHNNDFMVGKDMGGDKAKGDGSCDVKADSSFVTISYNHFMETGKSSLCGLSESVEFFVTYHHNMFDASGSRHPRVRVGTVHIYNNYFKDNYTYGVAAAVGSSLFVEANYFENCKRPMIIASQGSDLDEKGKSTLSGENGGTIKSLNNYMDEYSASTFNPEKDAALTADVGGAVYNNFDTSSTMYDYTADSPEDARVKVMQYAGRLND